MGHPPDGIAAGMDQPPFGKEAHMALCTDTPVSRIHPTVGEGSR